MALRISRRARDRLCTSSRPSANLSVRALALPEQVLARPAVKTAVHCEQRRPSAVPGPDRDQLLHLITDALAAAG